MYISNVRNSTALSSFVAINVLYSFFFSCLLFNGQSDHQFEAFWATGITPMKFQLPPDLRKNATSWAMFHNLVFMVVSLRFSDIRGFWTICFNTTKQFETFNVTSQFPNEIPWVLWFVSRTMFGTNLWWSWCRFGRCYGQTPCTRGGANRLEKGGMIGGSHIGCYMAT